MLLRRGTKRKRCRAAYAVPTSARKPVSSTVLPFPVAPIREDAPMREDAIGSGYTWSASRARCTRATRTWIGMRPTGGSTRTSKKSYSGSRGLLPLRGWDRRARRSRRLAAVVRPKGPRLLLDASKVHEESDALEGPVEAAHEHEEGETNHLRDSPLAQGAESEPHRLRKGGGGLGRGPVESLPNRVQSKPVH